MAHQPPRSLAFELDAYDFADFGCSDGGSIALAKFLFKGERGLGIDIDPAKVAAARSAGYDAIEADITKMDVPPGSVRFVIAHHFLEHLPDVSFAAKCIASACRVASDFVFIKQPYFDADPYLLQKGLKFYWSDWACHPNHMTSADFVRVLMPMQRKGEIRRFVVYAVSPVVSSADTVVHPITTKPDQQHYDTNKHPPKALHALEGVYREISVLILLRDGLDDMERRAPKTSVIFDSASL